MAGPLPPTDDVPAAPADDAEPRRRSFLRDAGVAGAGFVAGTILGATTVDDVRSAPVTPTAPQAGLPADRRAAEARNATWAGDAVRGCHRVIWDVATTEPVIALTFDDGPDPRFTPRVLDALAAAGATATFFMLGAMVERHPDLARRVVAEGHEVGNHTWSHENLTFLDPAAVQSEILRGAAAIRDVLGIDTPWFRPPRGQLTGASLRFAAEANQDTCIWSASRQLSEVGTPDAVAAAVLAQVRPGAVVDLHDSIGRGNFLPPSSRTRQDLLAKREVEMTALTLILQGVADAGLQSVAVSDLVAVAASPGALSPAVPAHLLPPGPTAEPTAPAGPVET
jgi:peptidoglycan-N-acetylglucosamine deacetylase